MYFISINDHALPVPFEYSVTSTDIESSDSGRSDETGVVHRNRIRRSVKICDVKWRVSGDMLEQLDEALSGELLGVSLLDPASAGYVSCDMYVSSIKSEFYQHQGQDPEQSWWEISCRLQEF